MAAYTFLWAGDTWEQRATDRALREFPYIDYVAGDGKRPLSEVMEGDEIFVVNVKHGHLRIGGRLVADGRPVPEAEAGRRLPRNRLIGKELYVFAKAESLDRFRHDFYLDQHEALSLELIGANGARKELTREQAGGGAGGIYRQEFRQPFLLSPSSAALLRRSLGISVSDTAEKAGAELLADLAQLEHTVADKTDREVLAKARIGQGRFRSEVERRWGLGEVCALTGLAVPETLIASHIKPWRDSSNDED
ncbi:MAG: HNH endonuclease signature motif containing protein [Pseudomonadota bacterium]